MKKKLLLTKNVHKILVKCLILMMLFSTNTFAQQFLTGKITDSESNQGLPGVNVAIKGTTTGTSTDGAGNFKLSVPKDKSVLVFSYVGYLNQEVAIANRTTVNVSMVSDNQTLSEVVVVGYGNQERRDVTGAVATIKTQNIKDLPVTSIDQKMAGQVACVSKSGFGSTRFRTRNSYSWVGFIGCG